MINFFKYPLIYPYTGNIRSTRLLGVNTLPCQSPISIEHVYLIHTIIWSTRVGMSKLCNLFLSRFRTILVEVDCIIIYASLIIERGKRVTKQSENWLMPTVNPNVYLRDGTSLVNLLRLFCPLYSFVLLLPINRLDSSTIRLQILSVTSDNVTYLRIAAT